MGNHFLHKSRFLLQFPWKKEKAEILCLHLKNTVHVFRNLLVRTMTRSIICAWIRVPRTSEQYSYIFQGYWTVMVPHFPCFTFSSVSFPSSPQRSCNEMYRLLWLVLSMVLRYIPLSPPKRKQKKKSSQICVLIKRF